MRCFFFCRRNHRLFQGKNKGEFDQKRRAASGRGAGLISAFCEKLQIRLLAPEVWRSLISSPPHPIRKCNSLAPFGRGLSLRGRGPFHLKVKRCLPFNDVVMLTKVTHQIQAGSDTSGQIPSWPYLLYLSDCYACAWANKILLHFKGLWNCQWIDDEMHST